MKHKTSSKRELKEALVKHEEKTEKQSFKCSVCSKEFKDRSGLGGHLWITHQIKVGPKAELKQLKSELEAALKQLENLKENSIPKDKIYACPKCNVGILGYDFKVCVK